MVLLVIGVRESARFNAAMVAIKFAAVLFFIAVGVSWVEPENWTPFAPYGTSGVLAAAAVVFFAYIGFDAVSTTAEEAKNPQPRPADRHHRVAGRLHDSVPRCLVRALRHRPGDAVPVAVARCRGCPPPTRPQSRSS